MIKTDICDLLQIEYPIFQGGMAWLGTAELAAAVSEAGGLGIIGAGHMPPDIFRNEIHKLKERTSKPFGCNIMLMSPFVKEVMEVVVEERVPVITTGAGNPGVYVPALKEIGTKVIPVVASVLLAKRLLRGGIDAIIADVEGYTINTFYPGVEGTIGLAGTNGGKLVEDSTSALTPENNHTIDSYIANAVHNRLSDINLRDVFDALITGADTFNDAMKVANQAHMGTMYTYNSKHYIACSLRNAINIFNTEIKSDIEKAGGAYKDIIDKQVKQTFADYGLNGVTLAHPETDLVRYANQLELTAVQDDLNRINQLQSILNGNLNNLKENGYFGTVEGTFDITNQNNRDTIVRMIQFLCDRNGLEYDPTTGHYTNLPALTDANAISSLTTYNADIFNYGP